MKASKKQEMILMWALALWLLAGCAPAIAPGDALQLQPGYTAKSIDAINQGLNSAGQVLQNPAGNAQVYAWPGDQGTWCFAILCQADPRVTGDPTGQMVEWSTFSAFINWLQGMGWSSVTPAIVPFDPEMLPEEVPQS